MKRIICVALTVVFALSLCASAVAEVYTHPTAGFQLTIPEGWMAVDIANLDEILAAGKVSEYMAANLNALRGILGSVEGLYIFKADATTPPFINMSVNYKGSQETDFTADDMLEIAEAYEDLYLKTPEQFPGYTAAMDAAAYEVEDRYVMSYLVGVYAPQDTGICLMQVLVGVDSRFYEFTLTCVVDDFDDDVATALFGLVDSLVAP